MLAFFPSMAKYDCVILVTIFCYENVRRSNELRKKQNPICQCGYCHLNAKNHCQFMCLEKKIQFALTHARARKRGKKNKKSQLKPNFMKKHTHIRYSNSTQQTTHFRSNRHTNVSDMRDAYPLMYFSE